MYFNSHHVIGLIINFVLLRTSCVWCFNLETRDPIIKKLTGKDKGSYFGFSVALHQDGKFENWLLVGAPLGQNLQPNTTRSGALFRCPISTYDNDCQQVKTDGMRRPGGRYKFESDYDYDEDDIQDDTLLPPHNDEIKDGQWMGVTVKSQKPGGDIFVCGHRYIQSGDLNKFQYGEGLCYQLDENFARKDAFLPCQGRPKDKLHQQYGFCQVGTSLALREDVAIVGAPGPFTWRGTIFGKMIEGDFLKRDKTLYQGPLNDNSEPIDKYSYLGMSVDAGHFHDKNKLEFVSGAPRADLVGWVYFMDRIQYQTEMNITLILKGEKFGSSFGYQLLAIDINRDGFDDLLVSAPFYYDDQIGGAVYIFMNLRNCTTGNCKPDQVLYGKSFSRFGFSLADLGDINKDGFNDVAIGAPYEQQHGRVYVFLGSAQGLNKEPSQEIREDRITTFGYSMSGGLDVDKNGYPDLLVGAYESDLVLLFKTRPIIDIKIDIVSDELTNINGSKKGCKGDPNNVHDTCFSFKVCCTILSTGQDSGRFSVFYDIAEQSKYSSIWFKNHISKSNHVRREQEVYRYSEQYCNNETVYVKSTVDIMTPIKFKVKYSLEDNTNGSPILNKTSVKEFQALFQKNCSSDLQCLSQLELSVKTPIVGDVFIVNGSDEFILETTVVNKNESAYDTKLYVEYSGALDYISLINGSNIICSDKLKHSLLECELGNPMVKGQKVKLKIRFAISRNNFSNLDLKINVTTISNNTSNRANTATEVHATIRRVVRFVTTGVATTNLFYGGEVVGESAMASAEDIGARINHTFSVENQGMWDLQNLNVYINFPYQVYQEDHNAPGKWLLYLEEIPTVVYDGISVKCIMMNSSIVDSLNLLGNKGGIRRKRGIRNFVVKSTEVTLEDKIRKKVVMECAERSAKCAQIKCPVKNLKPHDIAEVKIRSRIWNSTFVEDYKNVDWVVIRAQMNVTVDPSLQVSADSIRFSAAEIIAYPSEAPQRGGIQWWIILIAVIAGLIFLFLLIFVLYKCGFFKRNRLKDATLSANIIKEKDEQHQLLNNK